MTVVAVCLAMVLCLAVRGRAQQPPPLVYLANPGDAVCLDGSPPAYGFDPGSGSGRNSWIVLLQGGGWCGTVEDCQKRSLTDLGSSKYMSAIGFEGFLNNSPSDNPGNANSSAQVMVNGQTAYLYFRGQLVWEAIIDDLLAKGLSLADKAILSGESVGGSATIFLCNRFQEKLTSTTDVKCLADSGFFMDIPNIGGVYSFQEFFQDVVALHEITLLPSGCTSSMSLAQCYFSEYDVSYVNVPLFFVQSLYDNYQIRFILAPLSSYSNGTWDSCKQDFSTCSNSQISIIKDQLSDKMLQALSPLIGSQKWGMYLVSCYYHTEVTRTLWNGPTVVNGMNPSKAFQKWYFEEELVQAIDYTYPCNPTCTTTTPQ